MPARRAKPAPSPPNIHDVAATDAPECPQCMAADTLVEQLRRDPEIRQMLEGFESATGIKLKLAKWALPGPGEMREHVQRHPFCNRFLNSGDEALQHCIQMHTKLRVATENGPALVRCAPGLLHAGVAIFVHGEPIGFLLVSGISGPENADTHSYAEFHELLARSKAFVNNADLLILLGLLEKLERHPERRIDGVRQLLVALAHYIENYVVKYIPQHKAIFAAPLHRAVQYARKHHAYETLTLAQAAAEAGVTSQRLAQLFRRSMRETFTGWLTRYRVSKAMERLRSGPGRILDIALECGFGTVSSFNRAFRKFTGITPSEYRAGHEPRNIPTTGP